MTYSVVMRHPETGALGVAGQSHWFNLGRVVPWARPGVGAVATQSLADPTYGPRALDLLATGSSPGEALHQLLDADPEREVRQVSVIDAAGEVAAHTGTGCIPHASHEVGPGWSVQANIMRTDAVVPAMALAAAEAQGPLEDRLLAVLGAAEAAGGDLRGSQSAALLVVAEGPVPTVDLRVEDHPDPIRELTRLLRAHRVYEHMGAGDEALGGGDREQAARHYAAAAAEAEGNPEVLFWQALGLATMGQVAEAAAGLAAAAALNPDLLELLRRLPSAGLADEETVTDLIREIGAD